MEHPQTDRLIPLNDSYFEQFQARLATFNPTLKHTSVDRLVGALRDQLDEQSFEIVIRRLLGQTLPDIAQQMKLEWQYVGEVLNEAPKKIIAPSVSEESDIDKQSLEEFLDEPEPPVKGMLVAAHTVAKITGQRQNWTMQQLRISNLETTADTYRGRDIHRYNETEAVAYIRHILAERPKPAGDMMTIARMARELNKEDGWVAARVEERFKEFAETRLDDRNRPSTHYPRWVFRTLKDEVEVLETYPIATDDDYAIMDLARELQRDQKWVELRLLPLGIIGTTKISPYNKVPRVYYSDADLQLLRVENEKVLRYPVAGDDDATADALGRLMGHDLKWIKRRLPYIDVFPRTKLSPVNNQPSKYYPKTKAVAALETVPLDVFKTDPPIFVHESISEELPELVVPQKLPDVNVRAPRNPDVEPVIDSKEPIVIEATMATKTARVVIRSIQITGHPTARDLIEPINDEPNETNWREFGECLQYFPEMFFPEKGESAKDAKIACGKCAVTAFCLQYALDTHQQSGIFGGLSAQERKKLLKFKASN